jgi:hypothetical protein
MRFIPAAVAVALRHLWVTAAVAITALILLVVLLSRPSDANRERDDKDGADKAAVKGTKDKEIGSCGCSAIYSLATCGRKCLSRRTRTCSSTLQRRGGVIDQDGRGDGSASVSSVGPWESSSAVSLQEQGEFLLSC